MTDQAQTCRVRDCCVQSVFKICSHWKQSVCVFSSENVSSSRYVCPPLTSFSMFCKWGGRYFGEVYQGTIKGIML